MEDCVYPYDKHQHPASLKNEVVRLRDKGPNSHGDRVIFSPWPEEHAGKLGPWSSQNEAKRSPIHAVFLVAPNSLRAGHKLFTAGRADSRPG